LKHLDLSRRSLGIRFEVLDAHVTLTAEKSTVYSLPFQHRVQIQLITQPTSEAQPVLGVIKLVRRNVVESASEVGLSHKVPSSDFNRKLVDCERFEDCT